MRTLPTAVATAALLCMTAAPAFAAPANRPVVHKFSVPGVPGVSAWGSYTRSGGKVSITLCVKDSSAKVHLALVMGIAQNASFTRHQDISADATGNGKQACRSVTTADSSRLSVLASSVGRDGASNVGKLKTIYS
jgi:hypothetical protein